MFGDAKAKLPDGSIVGDFQDNDGWVYGVRLSYQRNKLTFNNMKANLFIRLFFLCV